MSPEPVRPMTPADLRHLRVKRGYTQKELARLLGWPYPKPVSRWEHGHDPIPEWVADVVRRMPRAPAPPPKPDGQCGTGVGVPRHKAWKPRAVKALRGALAAVQREGKNALLEDQILQLLREARATTEDGDERQAA